MRAEHVFVQEVQRLLKYLNAIQRMCVHAALVMVCYCHVTTWCRLLFFLLLCWVRSCTTPRRPEQRHQLRMDLYGRAAYCRGILPLVLIFCSISGDRSRADKTRGGGSSAANCLPVFPCTIIAVHHNQVTTVFRC